jgi:hypothetical protein
VPYDEQRARWAALRADQDVIDQAAARLRHEAAQDQYRGQRNPQVAYGLCALLDELSRHLRDIDDEVRRRVVDLCRAMHGETSADLLMPPARRGPPWPDKVQWAGSTWGR